MSERIYLEVEDAIERGLHLRKEIDRGLGPDLGWDRPQAISLGMIVLRDSAVSTEYSITPGMWSERVRRFGLWKSVGIWSFVRADDPAALVIRYCNRYPKSAGRELHRLRREVESLRRELQDA